jgi:predicted nucleic acid-binding protein
MNGVDTNVLIYARDPSAAEKQAIAISLIESLSDVVLLWQVACEYISHIGELRFINPFRSDS